MGAVFILRRKLDERNLMREDEGFDILHNGVWDLSSKGVSGGPWTSSLLLKNLLPLPLYRRQHQNHQQPE